MPPFPTITLSHMRRVGHEYVHVEWQAAHTMEQWPPAALDRYCGLTQWLVAVRAAAENRQHLQATVTEQAALLKVDNLPIADLT